ncbi:hypothetical protein [Flavobacterium celericrescens]|uniref:Uncharacterized protein n=1 Tax=Flavobacterium celericrescens TaxID=2709780 RepID=A0ABX0IAK3_9FLAO|nr:hypothetical protein [Flavobacterium celericrescens]NHM03662.1 hypothetical protein [Flavobacterium celericrescens]
MTEDKDIIKNLEYLDSILQYFTVTQRDYTADIISLSNDIFKLKLEKKQGDFPKPTNTEELFNSVFSPDNENAIFYKVKASIQYLVDEGYLFTSDNYTLKITYKGIIKYSEGFVTEYEKQTSDKTRLINVENFQRKMSRWMLFVNGAIAVGTIVAMVYYILEMISTPYCFCK